MSSIKESDDGNIFELINEECQLEDKWLEDKRKEKTTILKQMKWNVLVHDFNNGNIIECNIIRKSLIDDIERKSPNTMSELKEIIDSWAKYHYWSKAEYEIAVGGLFSKYPEEFEKIDVYRQIKMNLDRITEYVNNKLQIVRK